MQDSFKYIEGSCRTKVIHNGRKISLFTVPRWMPHRMSFMRIIREITGALHLEIRHLCKKNHFIAVEHRTKTKNVLIKSQAILDELKPKIKTKYQSTRKSIAEIEKELKHAKN